jgi:hypothetical protein
MIKDFLYKKGRELKQKLVASGVPEKAFPKIPTDSISPWFRELVDLMTFNCAESHGEIEVLIKSYPDNEQSTIPRLAEYQIKKIQADLKSGQKTLAIFYPSKAYRENLGSEDLYQRIRAQGYNVIFLFGVIRGDEFEKRPFSYYAGHDLVGHFNFIDAFIFPTLMPGLPFVSKKILFVHDIYDSPKGIAETAPAPSTDGKPQRVPPLLDELDYTFLPCKALMPPSNKMKLIRQKPICRIPGGYIKLDKNIQYFKSIETPIDSIIFAPTVHWDHFYDYVAVPEHGCDIVGALLEKFPGYKIIFRPHPHTVDTPEVQKVAKKFRQFYTPQKKLLVALADWHRDPISTQGKYFQVSSNCENDDLPGFEIHFRKNSNWKDPVKLADVLYPETSYTLNRQKAKIKTIHCEK